MIAFIAAFELLYPSGGLRIGSAPATTAAIEETFVIAPLCRSFITGSAAFAISSAPPAFTRMICSQASSSIHSAQPSPVAMPTLLWTTSSPPNRSTAVDTKRRQSSSALTSPSATTASPPSPAIASRVASAESLSRSTSTRRAPSRENRIAVARPLPISSPGVCPAPVTIATFPSNLPLDPPSGAIRG